MIIQCASGCICCISRNCEEFGSIYKVEYPFPRCRDEIRIIALKTVPVLNLKYEYWKAKMKVGISKFYQI